MDAELWTPDFGNSGPESRVPCHPTVRLQHPVQTLDSRADHRSEIPVRTLFPSNHSRRIVEPHRSDHHFPTCAWSKKPVLRLPFCAVPSGSARDAGEMSANDRRSSKAIEQDTADHRDAGLTAENNDDGDVDRFCILTSEKLQEEAEEVEEEEVEEAGEMLKRGMRLHGSSERDSVGRNENGLVTRVRRSFMKSKPLVKGPPPKPMFATVCVNNVNRSMEAHHVLQEAGLRVCSFGAGAQVCFPGSTATTPRVFGFSTTYEEMYEKLRAEDEPRYTQNGVLRMLERNMRTKRNPQRWQMLSNKQVADIDVIVCLDYTMFIKVLNDLRMRIRFCFQKKHLHVICLEVDDTPEAAESGSALTLQLCQEINEMPDRSEAKVKDVIVRFEKQHKLELFYVGLSV